MSVINLRPEHEKLADELRRLADQLDSGEIAATTGLVILRNRVEQDVRIRICGEPLAYTALMGLCCYAEHRLFAEAQQ